MDVSKDLQSLGSKARAKKLSQEDRSAIAKNEADKRWSRGSQPFPKAAYEGVLNIGGMEVPSAVLENGTKVLTEGGVMVALGRARHAKGRQY